MIGSQSLHRTANGDDNQSGCRKNTPSPMPDPCKQPVTDKTCYYKEKNGPAGDSNARHEQKSKKG
jgi:hypothetical protein